MGILYCRCAYAQVLPPETKEQVLEGLCASGQPFTAVPDLCEMSARRDPRLASLAAQTDQKIVACHKRAVEWLFHAAGSPLAAADTQVINLRELTAAAALEKILEKAPPNA